jgi:hypothetical protein
MLVQTLAGRGPRDVDQRMERLLKQAAVHPAAHSLTIMRRLPSVGVPDALWLGAGGLGLSAVGTACSACALLQPVARGEKHQARRKGCQMPCLRWKGQQQRGIAPSTGILRRILQLLFIKSRVLRRWTVPLK